MADNYSAGGYTFGSDDVAGTQMARIKKVLGPDGIAADCWTSARLISAATTNATSVKASAGALGFIVAANLNAAVRYLKLYNKASAPTVGTDTPVMTMPIPASTAGNGFTIAIPNGVSFTTGIALALTTGYADADTAAVAAGEIFLFIGYV